MSWETFQKDAYKLTQREIKRLTVQVLKEYREAIKALSFQLQKTYLNLTGIDPKDYYNEMIKRDRLKNLLKQVRSEYNKYSLKAGSYIKQASNLAFSNTYYRKMFASQWITNKAVFAVLPKSLIELSTLGTAEAWKNLPASIEKRFGKKSLYIPQTGTLSSLLKNNRTKELARIQTAITQSITNGQSYTEAVNNIRGAIGTETVKDGVTKFTGSKADALRIIRTETNRIQNNGALANSQVLEANDIDVQKQWVAVLDIKTRSQSASMDGQRKAVNEPFVYPNGATSMTPGTSGVGGYDINDRCGMIDIIDGQGPQIRRGRNPVTGENEVFEYKDFDQWAKDNGLKKNFYGEIVAK